MAEIKADRDSSLVTVYLHETAAAASILQGAVLATATQTDLPDTSSTHQQIPDDVETVISDRMLCSTCTCAFSQREDQRHHYKTDWHRYNLRLKLKGSSAVSEDVFEELTGDVSSISGSDTDSDSSGDDNLYTDVTKTTVSDSDERESYHVEGFGRRHPRVFLRNNEGRLLSIYRCVIHGKKKSPETADELLKMVSELPNQMTWMVVMVAGGHFAAAVYQKGEMIAHKTFHRYVVRKKRGIAQSVHDAQGHAPKSAGASLRRYNERALTEEIEDLLKRWSELYSKCDRLFLRAASHSKSIFFGGKNPPLDKKDPRIRLIPFPTRRPTLKEVKRVHALLSTIDIYDPEADIMQFFKSPKKAATPLDIVTKSETEKVQIERESVVNGHDRMQPSPEMSTTKCSDSASSSGDDVVLTCMLETLETSELQEYACTKKPNRKRKKKERKSNRPGAQECKTPEDENGSVYTSMQNDLYTACKTGNLQSLMDLLAALSVTGCSPPSVASGTHATEETPDESQASPPTSDNNTKSTEAITPADVKDLAINVDSQTVEGDSMLPLLNVPFGPHQMTLLHVTSKSGKGSLIPVLMDAGADPVIRDKGGQTPYAVACDKATRNEFRRYMAKHPDKYDYVTAQIPGPLTEAMEAERKARETEKKKQQRKAKKDKIKEESAEAALRQKEEKEKQRFLALSDREKRAIAAERRLLAQKQADGQVCPSLCRCWQCGVDLTGKVPFEYSDYRFCSPKCLKTHRMQAAASKTS